MQLAEKYRPKRIFDFIGLATPKKTLTAFAARPTACAWLFVGRSGAGKTAMARALAEEVSAKLHMLPAHECTRENVARLWNACRHAPGTGLKRHLILVDYADRLTKLHQSDLRSKLDGPEMSPNVIWVFTAESAEHLNGGFRSRCRELNFSTYGSAQELAVWLEMIWESENPQVTGPKPNFARIIKESKSNMLLALNRLEHEMG